MRVLEIFNLHKSYGKLKAVNNVSLHVEAGEIMGSLGPNGAGKTTLINAVMTLEDIDSGSIKIAGLDLAKEPRICKTLTGFMPQEVINHGYFTLEEVMFYHSGYYGYLSNKDRLISLMKKFALWEHRHKKILQLSGGMKRRLLLAKSLVHNPSLILLDEPTTGVDVNLRHDIWNLVKDLRNEGKAILFTTHYIEEAEKLCDRVAIINSGKLVTENKTLNLIREFTLRKFIITLNKNKELHYKNVKKIREDMYEFSLHFSVNVGEFLKEIDIQLDDIKDIQIQEGTLEEVFRNVLKEDQA